MTQKEALDILKMGHSVFLTGAAGAGKTHTLRAYIAWLREEGIETAITASTGIAATHLGGTTIHSWSGLGVRDKLSAQDIDELESRQYLWKRYETTKVLIIDEISMLHHFRFDLLDKLARSFKRNELPFGGMQVVVCGDFFQLPPVSRMGEPPAFFAYSSDAWKNLGLKICYLTEQHRQNDDAFLSVLGDIRSGDVTDDTLEHLRGRYMKEAVSAVQPTKLSTHNENVDAINERELAKIGGDLQIFNMTSHGRKNLVEALKKSCLAPEALGLKAAARVMFVKNNFEKGYVNGTLGEVQAFDDFDAPVVKMANGKHVQVSPESWKVDEDGKTKAEISQMPLRLAWAITIHKSQGMSLDAAEIDLSRSFAPGMGYVALSRVRTLAGIKLLGLGPNALVIHPEVRERDVQFQEESKAAVRDLEALGAKAIAERIADFVFKNSTGKKKSEEEETLDSLPTHIQTKLLIAEKLPLAEIAMQRELKTETIISHIEKLLEEKHEIDIEHIRPAHFKGALFEKISKAFKESLAKNKDFRLAPVKALLDAQKQKVSYEDLRLARLFLELTDEE